MAYTNAKPEFSRHPDIRQDLFVSIPYVMGTGKHRTVPGLRFPYVFLPKWALEMTWSHCTMSVSSFDKGNFYTTEMLLDDPALWGRYKDGPRRIFGRCVRFFEHSKMLPIRCINSHASGTKQYQIL